MREAFYYADHRAPKSAAVETDRLLPAGVRSYFREVKAGEDLSHLPLVILDWMYKHDLVRKSESTKNRGALILSPLGQQVRNINQRRMEGKND